MLLFSKIGNKILTNICDLIISDPLDLEEVVVMEKSKNLLHTSKREEIRNSVNFVLDIVSKLLAIVLTIALLLSL